MTLCVPFRPAGVVSTTQDAYAFVGNFYIPNVSDGAGGGISKTGGKKEKEANETTPVNISVSGSPPPDVTRSCSCV
jgi:hypothetical protein